MTEREGRGGRRGFDGPVNSVLQPRAAQQTVHCNPFSAAHAPAVHRDCAVAERHRRDQLKSSRAGEPALAKCRAVTGDPGVDEE